MQSEPNAYVPQITLPVVSPSVVSPQLVWLQSQDTRTSKDRIHIMSTSQPPYCDLMYLGKDGLLRGKFGGAGLEEQILVVAFAT